MSGMGGVGSVGPGRMSPVTVPGFPWKPVLQLALAEALPKVTFPPTCAEPPLMVTPPMEAMSEPLGVAFERAVPAVAQLDGVPVYWPLAEL